MCFIGKKSVRIVEGHETIDIVSNYKINGQHSLDDEVEQEGMKIKFLFGHIDC